MTGAERTWEDMNHTLYFLPYISHMENGKSKLAMSRSVDGMVNPLARHGVYAKGNMENISETIPINISITPRVVKNFYIGVYFSQDEVCEYTKLFKEFRDVFA
jgi:hypothetical protein